METKADVLEQSFEAIEGMGVPAARPMLSGAKAPGLGGAAFEGFLRSGSGALELKAKSQETAYEVIKLWLRKSDGLPVKAQYFGTSGQMLRSAEFTDYQEFEKGYLRPAKVVMRNELVKARRSELVMKTVKLNVDPTPGVDSTPTVPPIAPTRPWQIASPSPVPP